MTDLKIIAFDELPFEVQEAYLRGITDIRPKLNIDEHRALAKKWNPKLEVTDGNINVDLNDDRTHTYANRLLLLNNSRTNRYN